jgi:MFS family permease
VPASLSLLTAIFAKGEERNRAIGVYGAMAALGFVVGMVGGGVITEFLGWRWVLFVNVPVALAALLPAPAVVPESRNERAPRSLDVAGALTVTSGLASLIYAVSEVPDSGWTSNATLGFGALVHRGGSCPPVILGPSADETTIYRRQGGSLCQDHGRNRSSSPKLNARC